MDDQVITVGLKDQTVTVDKPKLSVPHGESPRITWKVADGEQITLRFVGFMDPVGLAHPIQIPQAGTTHGTIFTVDNNKGSHTQPVTFKYLLWVQKGDAVYCSEDPEIINDPQGGAEGGPPS